MQVDDLTIIAPFTLGGQYNEAEVFGATVWLWMHSASHQNAALHTLPAVMLPAIKNQQFVLIHRGTQPVAYFSLGWLNEEAEHRYLTQPFVMMQPEDWCSGDRLWIFDCIAPFGDMSKLRKIFFDLIFPEHFGRMLYHRGRERGQQVKVWYGRNVDRAQAKVWFEEHPVMLTAPTLTTSTSTTLTSTTSILTTP